MAKLIPDDLAEIIVAARRELTSARDDVKAWMDDQAREQNLVIAGQAPAWPRYDRAQASWNAALQALDAQLAN